MYGPGLGWVDGARRDAGPLAFCRRCRGASHGSVPRYKMDSIVPAHSGVSRTVKVDGRISPVLCELVDVQQDAAAPHPATLLQFGRFVVHVRCVVGT